METKQYHLNDFLKYRDEEFVINAYRTLLGRDPVDSELELYLTPLRKGRLHQIEILGRLKYSKEGRQKQLKVTGLFIRFLVHTSYRIPVLGYLLAVIVAVASLPRLNTRLNTQLNTRLNILPDIVKMMEEALRRIEEIEAKKADHHVVEGLSQLIATVELSKADRLAIDDINDQLRTVKKYFEEQRETIKEVWEEFWSLKINKTDNEIVEDIGRRLKNSELTIKDQQNAILTSAAALEAVIKADRQALEETKAQVTLILSSKVDNQRVDDMLIHLSALEAVKADRPALDEITNNINEISKRIKYSELTLLDHQRSLALLLEEVGKRRREPISAQRLENVLREEDQLMNVLYLSFEDRFRGTQEEIKNRQKNYLPYVEAACSGMDFAPILDVGCGRGEWLELLKENGYGAKGVDINRAMISMCSDRGLEVVEAEAVEYLRQLENNSVRVITGFHIIEHLSVKTLLALFDESFRVLVSGGMVIFETPNPENLIVGACNFYYDLTHKRPLPPESTRFIIEQRGFKDTQILRLNMPKTPEHIGVQSVDAVLDIMYSAQDYAIIGYKV
ncbi:MAG: methyltransferase domain-containing protein [Deltaproteobacteria bacterium]|nr:methyltransferase domain-containing protein [Deltaproteobacteria bacterium]